MFGIGLPEMIVIFAVALIVVGPDKLPGLARSLAKGLMELKTTLNQVKDNLTQEDDTLKSVQHDLRNTADVLREKMLNADPANWQPAAGPEARKKQDEIIDVEPEARAIEAELRSEYPPAESGKPGEGQESLPQGESPAGQPPAAAGEKKA